MPEAYGQLIIQLPDKTSRTVPLRLGRITIGRTQENDVVLNSPLVSARHAEIEITESGALLTDLGSKEGTFASGERLLPNHPMPIENGTVIQIGLFIINYVAAPVSNTLETKANGRKKLPPEPVAEPALPLLVPIQKPPAAPPRVAQPFHEFVRSLSQVQDGKIDRSRSLYLEMLPVIFQEQDFLGRFLMIFERLWEPLEWRQDHIEMYFDPRTAPVGFLGWLERWLGLEHEPRQHWDERRRREFLINATDLYRKRGTTLGLQNMIEICTGFTVQIGESAPYCFTVTMQMADLQRAALEIPADGRDVSIRVEGLKRFVEELIVMHKPAHAGYTLEFV